MLQFSLSKFEKSLKLLRIFGKLHEHSQSLCNSLNQFWIFLENVLNNSKILNQSKNIWNFREHAETFGKIPVRFYNILKYYGKFRKILKIVGKY